MAENLVWEEYAVNYQSNEDILGDCWELTTLLVARLDKGIELKVTDPKEQQWDVEEKETEGKERQDMVDC